jgi:hypothetical protein
MAISLSGPGLALAVGLAGVRAGSLMRPPTSVAWSQSAFRALRSRLSSWAVSSGCGWSIFRCIELGGRTTFTWTEFSPSAVCTERSVRVAGRCSEIVGEPLFPVGTDGFHLTIYVSPAGRFF